MPCIEIRQAQESDVDSIFKLSLQLGYEPTRDNVMRGIQTLNQHPDYELVVITEDDAVVGWMSLAIRQRIEDQPYMQVTAVVTEESRRGSGFGKRLMDYAETQAKKAGVRMLALYSRNSRVDAHLFYKKHGYRESKVSTFFSKDV